MKRDELIKTIGEEITKVLPDEDKDLDGDDLDAVDTCVMSVTADAASAIDSAEDEGDEGEEKAE